MPNENAADQDRRIMGTVLHFTKDPAPALLKVNHKDVRFLPRSP